MLPSPLTLYPYSPDLRFLPAGPAFFGFGYFILHFQGKATRGRLALLGAFSIAMTVLIVAWTVGGIHDVWHARAHGLARSIQGTVSDLRNDPARRDGGFRIGSISFAYSASSPQPGFNGDLDAGHSKTDFASASSTSCAGSAATVSSGSSQSTAAQGCRADSDIGPSDQTSRWGEAMIGDRR